MNKLPTLDVFMHRAAIDPQKNRSLGFQWLFEKKDVPAAGHPHIRLLITLNGKAPRKARKMAGMGYTTENYSLGLAKLF